MTSCEYNYDMFTTIDWHVRDIPSRTLSSFTFLVLMFSIFKPKVWIVGKISKCPLKDSQGAGPDAYWFKIINLNLFFKCHDLKFSLFVIEPHFSGGKNIILDSVALKKSDLAFLRSLSSDWGRDGNDEYACRIRTEEDIRELLGTTKSLRLQLVAKHQLSGLTSYFTKDFNIDDIEDGAFKSGFTDKIIKK